MKFEVALIVLIASIVVRRVLSERALKHLSSRQKAALVDAFSGQRAFGLVPPLVLLAVFFVVLKYTRISPSAVTIAYWIALLIYILFNFVYTQRTLKKLSLPTAYVQQFGIARSVQYVGLGVLFYSVFTQLG